MLWPWPPVHLGQLAPISLPQCRLVSNPCSAGLSLSGPSLCASLHPTLSLSLRDPPSLSRIKRVSGCSVGLYPPPGFEPSSTKQKRCAVPIVLRRDAFFALLLCSADLFCSLSLCLPLSLSLSLCLALSLPPRPSFAPSPHPPQGFFLCLCRILHPPACCPLSGISPFAWRCAQQRVEEPYNVSGYRVYLLEERSLEQN